MRLRTLGILAFLSCLCVAQAQTLYGPGGLIINPTAYSNPAGYFEINSSIFNRQVSGSTISLYPISATYAFTGRMEAGALYVGQLTGSRHDDLGGLYIKDAFLSESKGRPAFALIGTSLTGAGTTSTLTLMGSKEITPGWHLHLGARYVNYSFDSRADGNLIAGTDFMVAKRLRFIAEADSRLYIYQFGSEAFGLQYMGPVVVTVGLVNQASNRYAFFFGVGYPVGKP